MERRGQSQTDTVATDFQLQMTVPSPNGFYRISGHDVRRIDTDRKVRCDALAAAAKEAIEGQTITLAEEIMDGDVEGGLSRCIVDHRPLDCF